MQETQRFDRIDVLRGAAMVWMTAFHFSFDLSHFAYWQQDFYNDPFWTWQRGCIVSLFLFCAGLSQAVALAQGQPAGRFWRRWGQVAGCALLVTLGSVVMFPQSFIYFGVLHGIAVMLVIGRFTACWRRWLWLAGALAIALFFIARALIPVWAQADFLNEKAWSVLGLISRRPITEDYVPLAPWLGVLWWGMAAGQALLAHHPGWLAGPVPGAALPFAWLGRWSLSYYMLHQPVMIGVLMAIAALR